jgi:hypothetical protein
VIWHLLCPTNRIATINAATDRAQRHTAGAPYTAPAALKGGPPDRPTPAKWLGSLAGAQPGRRCISYIMPHFRTRGRVMPAQPVLRSFKDIEHRDAMLAYHREEPVRDEQGRPVTAGTATSMRVDLATGRDVPDESKRVEFYRYVNPRPAKWPAN